MVLYRAINDRKRAQDLSKKKKYLHEIKRDLFFNLNNVRLNTFLDFFFLVESLKRCMFYNCQTINELSQDIKQMC